jgi:hypothetical protein
MLHRAASAARASWARWLPGGSWDGSDLDPVNRPLLDALFRETGRAVRIVDLVARTDREEFWTWVDCLRGGGGYGSNAVDELTISCAPSRAAFALAEELLTKWISEGTSADNLTE